MRHHTHQVPSNKSADTILDEFLLGQQQQHKNFLKRLPQQDTTTNLKVPSSPGNTKPFASPTATTQRNQNLLFSISGGGRGSGRDHESTFQHASGMTSSSLEAATSQIVQIQRKLIGFFFIYATIILTLYLTYAVYSYYQQSQFRLRQQQQFVVAETATIATSNTGGITPASSLVSANNLLDEQQQSSDQEVSSGSLISKQMQEFQTKLEDKIHLLERYIEVLSLDLEDTKGRLKEREKCACSIGCSFNGTRYSDGQRWQSKCDTCTCQSGKISCLPRECPKLTCDDPVQLPGRCCPTCMKKCKINNTLVRHGHSFRPSQLNGEPAGKQCKCHDGLIKCEPIKPELDSSNGSKSLKVQQQSKFPAAGAKNRTLEYLKSILVTRSAQMQLDSTVGHQQPLRNNSSSSSSEAGGTSGL